MNTLPKYKMMVNSEKETLFVQFTEGEYTDVIAKIGNISSVSKNGEIEFDLELPKGFEKYYDDETYCSLIQQAVIDITVKSVEKFREEAVVAMLVDFNGKIEEYLKDSNIEVPENETYITMLAKQGYIVSETDEGKLIATKTKGKAKEVLSFDNDLAKIKRLLSPTLLMV